jgi:hypothetical protein
MSLPIISLALFFGCILISRFHLLPLRWNRWLVFLPLVGNILTLGVFLSVLEQYPSTFLILLAVQAASALFITWLACARDAEENTLRSIEFIAMQSILLCLPLLLPRIEITALSWLGSSWLWIYWNSKNATNGSKFSWISTTHLASDCVLFVALFFFYAGGLVGNYPWSFSAHTSTSLSSGVFFIWIASALRISLCALVALIDDARRTNSREDAPLFFMQAAGFAAPAALLLLNPDFEILGEPFSEIHRSTASILQGVSLFAVGVATYQVFSTRKTRVAVGAFCLSVWGLWLTSLTELHNDWVLVFAFQTIAALALVSLTIFTIETKSAAAQPLRLIMRVLFCWLIAGWALVAPSTPLFFQLDRLTALISSDGYGYLFHYYILTLCTAAVVGRLFYTAILWNDTATAPVSPRVWATEITLTLAAIFYLSLDGTVMLSISGEALTWRNLAIYFLPLAVPFIAGAASARWMAPPAPTREKVAREMPGPISTSDWQRLPERFATVIWYSPVFLIRSSSRALAGASSHVFWLLISLTAFALLLKRGVF